MARHRRSLAVLAPVAASVLALTACASTADPRVPAGPLLGAVEPASPPGEVAAQGMVMDVGGEVEFCLGPVAESYPPQCSGIPISNWTWDGVEGSETSEQITWGAYAVQGLFNGETFSVTQPPVTLALYDPMPFPDPTGGEPGAGTQTQLLGIQEQLPDRLGDAYLSSYPENGYLWVDVVWDDGAWQDAADDEFGDDVVVIRSALRHIEG